MDNKDTDAAQLERDRVTERCRAENHKDMTKVITTIAWAVCVAMLGLNFNIAVSKNIIFATMLLFSVSILSEFFASLSFIKFCDLNDKCDPDLYFYRKLGIIFQRIRNYSFIIAFILFIITLTIQLYETK